MFSSAQSFIYFMKNSGHGVYLVEFEDEEKEIWRVENNRYCIIDDNYSPFRYDKEVPKYRYLDSLTNRQINSVACVKPIF